MNGIPEFTTTFADHAFFRGVGAKEVATLRTTLRQRHWRAGETIFQRGDDGAGIIAITAGVVRLSLDSAEGRELTVRMAGPGEMIGELALLDGGGRSTDATAVTGITALVLAHVDFRRLFATSAALQDAVLRTLCARLRDTTSQLQAIALLPLENRLARLFVLLAQRSGVRRADGRVAFELRLAQRELAALVGATRPKVNRVLVGWDASGLIARNGGIVACDLAALRLLGEPDS